MPDPIPSYYKELAEKRGISLETLVAEVALREAQTIHATDPKKDLQLDQESWTLTVARLIAKPQ